MFKQSYRPVSTDDASNNPFTQLHHRARGASPISQLETRSSGHTREQLIRIAAYHRYEMRCDEPGHDVEDWLAAEAEVGPPSAA